MIKNKIQMLLVSFSVLLGVSCEDVFENDIRDEVVEQIFPNAGQVLTTTEVPFQWSDSEEADSFRLQIAREDNLFVRDTLVDAISFVETLETGRYKWRVRAENFAYESKYSDFSLFFVEASSNLEEVSLVLNSPVDNAFTNSRSILFSWERVEGEVSYVFTLVKGSNGVETVLFTQEDLIAPQIQLSESQIEQDGVYRWTVKAVNQETETTEFSRVINIDTQLPPMPQLNSPTIDQEFSVNTAIEFSWSFADLGELQSSIASRIEISKDIDFMMLSDSSNVQDFSYSFTPNEQGVFYWRVVGTDAANNQGEVNDMGRFIVN